MIHHSAKMHFHIQEVAVMVSVPVIVKTSMMLRSGNCNRCHYGTPNVTKISCLCRLDHSSSSWLWRNVWIEVWSLERILTFSRTFQGLIPGTISDISRIDSGNDLEKVLSREFWSCKFWSGGPKFSLDYVVCLMKNLSGLKTLILGHLSSTREYKMTLNQQRICLGNSQCTWGSLKQN